MRIEAEFQDFQTGYDSRERGPIRGEVSHIVNALRGRRISQLSFAVLQIGSQKDCRRLIDMLLQVEHCFDKNILPAEVVIPVEEDPLEYLLKMREKELRENEERSKLLGK